MSNIPSSSLGAQNPSPPHLSAVSVSMQTAVRTTAQSAAAAPVPKTVPPTALLAENKEVPPDYSDSDLEDNYGSESKYGHIGHDCVQVFEKFCDAYNFSYDKPPCNKMMPQKMSRKNKNILLDKWWTYRQEATLQTNGKYRPMLPPKPKLAAPQKPTVAPSVQKKGPAPKSSPKLVAELAASQQVKQNLPSPSVVQAHKDVDAADRIRIANIAQLEAERKDNAPKVDTPVANNADPTKLSKLYSTILKSATVEPNVPQNVLDSIDMLGKAVCSQPDVVAKVSFPDRQGGLRRKVVAGYPVCATLIDKIAMVVSHVLYTEQVRELARDYAYAELEKAKRPPGKDGAGGYSYDAAVDLGDNYVEVYAVASIFRALESDLILWRASPKSAQATPADWKRIGAIASLVMAGGAVVSAFSAGFLASLGIAATVIFGLTAKTKVPELLHKALFPNDAPTSKLRAWFGLEKERPNGHTNVLSIATNLDLASVGYSTQKYAALLAQPFPLSPPEETPLSAFHQRHLDDVKDLSKGTSKTTSGGPKSSRLLRWQKNAQDSLFSAQCRQLHDFTLRKGISSPCSDLLCPEFYLQTKNSLNQRRPISIQSLRLSVPTKLVAHCSSQNSRPSNQCRARRGSLDSQLPSVSNLKPPFPNLTEVMFPHSSLQRYFVKVNASKCLGAPLMVSAMSHTSTTATSTPVIYTSRRSPVQPWSPQRSASRAFGTTIHSFISTCQGQMKKLVSGTQNGIKSLVTKTLPISTAQGWTQLKENLSCSLRSQLCGRTACRRRSSDTYESSSEIAARLRDPAFASTDARSCAPESRTQPSSTPLLLRQPSLMAQFAVVESEEKTSLIAEKETTASASSPTSSKQAFVSPTNNLGSSSNAFADIHSTNMSSVPIDFTPLYETVKSNIGQDQL